MTKKIKNLYIIKKWIKLHKFEKIFLIYTIFFSLYIIFVPLIEIKNINTFEILQKINIISFQLPFLSILIVFLLLTLILYNFSYRFKKIIKIYIL